MCNVAFNLDKDDRQAVAADDYPLAADDYREEEMLETGEAPDAPKRSDHVVKPIQKIDLAI
jgi:hypothetical protein